MNTNISNKDDLFKYDHETLLNCILISTLNKAQIIKFIVFICDNTTSKLLSNNIEYKVVGVCIANVCCGIRALTCWCFCLNFSGFFLILLWVFQLIF